MSTELVTAAVLGLVINEFCDISPWIARKVIRLAARSVPDPEVRERLEEEWAAGLQDRPGKILKLISALTILASALTTVRGMYLGLSRLRRTRRFLGKFFDREGRRVMVTSALASAVNAVSPWNNNLWAMLGVLAVLSIVTTCVDFWLLARKRRREIGEGPSGVR